MSLADQPLNPPIHHRYHQHHGWLPARFKHPRLALVETRWRIEALLRELPEMTRATFLLSQVEGLTYAQIGHCLNLSPITVKRYMRAAFIACLSVA